jgi:STAS-like domain of unknown function (DUF4325)
LQARGEGNLSFSRTEVAMWIAVRLESFDTVDLAFEGVASTGQAFADELFRVLGKRHAHVWL